MSSAAAIVAALSSAHHLQPSPGYSLSSAPPSRNVRLTVWRAVAVATTSPVSEVQRESSARM